MRLANKVTIITGAAMGLGRAMAEQSLAEGAVVIGVDLQPLEYTHPSLHSMVLNVTDAEACQHFVELVVSTHGRIDVLVNNAGITQDAMTVKMTDAQWQKVFDVNLRGVFHLVRHIGPLMEHQGGGSIINIASVVGEFGNIGQANYAATKAGLIGATKSWAKEFSRKGVPVRVNAISPGYIKTSILSTISQELLDTFASWTMLKRLGEPHEIANAMVFLASEESSYITGTVLQVNGGMRL